MVSKGDTIASNAHIFGPFEAGFGAQQSSIIEGWGCLDPTVVYDSSGGKDIGIAEQIVAYKCGLDFPRAEGDRWYGIVGPCGGHTNDYHFHKSFSCLYAASGQHSTKVGDVGPYSIYGQWEDYSSNQLPLLDACGAHFGPTPESATAVYHYHVQEKAPFSVGCFGPDKNGELVSVATCRSLYSSCDDDGGSGTTIQTGENTTVIYDLDCPCFDKAGSNMGTNIDELPALSSSAISYTKA